MLGTMIGSKNEEQDDRQSPSIPIFTLGQDGRKLVVSEDVISLILHHSAPSAKSSLQKTLRPYALVSKSWYCATIPLLYRSPQLSPSNINSFARTLYDQERTPTTSTWAASLAPYVKHLELRGFDGHGSVPVIRRILGSVGLSLENFKLLTVLLPSTHVLDNRCHRVPGGYPVAQNGTILHSLSGCLNLNILDLSGLQENVDFRDVLLATAHLSKLEDLRMPHQIFDTSPVRIFNGSRRATWPPNMRHLQVSDWWPIDSLSWSSLLLSLPKTLKSLAIPSPWTFNWLHDEMDAQAAMISQIETIEIIEVKGYFNKTPIIPLLGKFRNVKTLRLPLGELFSSYLLDQVLENGRVEMLSFTLPYKAIPVGKKVFELDPLMRDFLDAFPTVRSLSVPERYICGDWYDLEEIVLIDPGLIEIDTLLAARGESAPDAMSGLFVQLEGERYDARISRWKPRLPKSQLDVYLEIMNMPST